MWTCPVCGRAFRNVGQHHYCGNAPETVDEYILAQDENIRDQLQRVRSVLRSSLPDAAEKISWSMPTYWDQHNLIHFAATNVFNEVMSDIASVLKTTKRKRASYILCFHNDVLDPRA